MTHEVWADGVLVYEGSKGDCNTVAVFLRDKMRNSNEKVAGRVGIHSKNKEEDE